MLTVVALHNRRVNREVSAASFRLVEDIDFRLDLRTDALDSAGKDVGGSRGAEIEGQERRERRRCLTPSRKVAAL